MIKFALPPEVLDEIFQYFSEDTTSLKALSLVSQAFLECSRPRLFSYLDVELELVDVSRLTQVGQRLGKHIVFLYIGLGNTSESCAKLPSPLAISKLIGTLTNLQILHIRMDHGESGAKYMISATLAALKAASVLPHVSHLKLKTSPCLLFLNYLIGFPSLKHLIIHFRDKYRDGKSLEYSDETCHCPQTPIFLESLKLYWEDDGGELYQWLLCSTNPIKMAKVKRFMAASPFEETSTHNLLQQILSSCSSLQDFYLYPSGTFKHWQPEEDPINLNVCQKLRALGYRMICSQNIQSQKGPMSWVMNKITSLDVSNNVESLTLDLVLRKSALINAKSTWTSELQLLRDSFPCLRKLRIRTTSSESRSCVLEANEVFAICLEPYKMDWSVEYAFLDECTPGRLEHCTVAPLTLRRVGSSWHKLLLCWDVTDYGV
ncbi:hypothetical protein CPB83DRAFT_449733 [Crepidotus variabilis]|uniref:F-box domain-containing protein n=1 Tax=Crepidotus variabilis TaxID=179855 RepID=A0A9P6ED54_9AGAR|nr:hypothetical protein CPB83DRAFT_449733 [Crepidotus variabilis]